jgi:hypothetical protein|tara:strand:- start:1038 stop:1346 length:309 start_codon:yes stop_codon:yes gene_type:complete
MKKFIKAYNNILEQDDIEMEVPVDEPEADPVAEPEPEVQQLSPEGEVLLIRLIKKALVTKIDSSDVDTLSELSDINEINAKSSLEQLINIMKKYSRDIDVAT